MFVFCHNFIRICGEISEASSCLLQPFDINYRSSLKRSPVITLRLVSIILGTFSFLLNERIMPALSGFHAYSTQHRSVHLKVGSLKASSQAHCLLIAMNGTICLYFSGVTASCSNCSNSFS